MGTWLYIYIYIYICKCKFDFLRVILNAKKKGFVWYKPTTIYPLSYCPPWTVYGNEKVSRIPQHTDLTLLKTTIRPSTNSHITLKTQFEIKKSALRGQLQSILHYVT